MNREEQVERLIELSITNPVLPDEFIPWEQDFGGGDVYMPNYLISLYGTELYDRLSEEQKEQLARLEVSQVMATYAWSESIACLFFTEMLIKVSPTSQEGKYLVRMLIEEFRHQYMFARVIDKIGVNPKPFSALHRMLATIATRTLGERYKYVMILAVEQVSDIYARHLRREQDVYIVLRKSSELHHIEEGRHMAYQKLCLKEYIEEAGRIQKTIIGIVYALTIWFMRSQYVRKSFFTEAGISTPHKYYKTAVKNYRRIFGKHCLQEAIAYTRSIGALNAVSRPVWNLLLKAGV
jgi:hypothetical protein